MYTVFDGAAVLPAPEKSRVEDVRQVKTLNEHMKTGQFKRSYLLYGEEAYLKKQYKEKLTKAMFPDGDTVNYAYFEGKGTEPSKLIDLAETMPFFFERRLIVVENSGFFKSSCPELADYIRQMPDTACFLFVEEEADKRGKMFKAVKETGYALELKRQDEKTLLLWIARQVKGEQKQIKESKTAPAPIVKYCHKNSKQHNCNIYAEDLGQTHTVSLIVSPVSLSPYEP